MYLYCIFGVLLLLVLYVSTQDTKEGFMISYSYPWGGGRDTLNWNGWRSWYNPGWFDRFWKPRCPAGCVYTGGNTKSGFACPNGAFQYGQFECQYDRQCDGCQYPMEGTRFPSFW
jgi:hypothetical protein